VSVRLAVVAALEALEVGDVEAATRILLDAVEDGPRPDGVRCDGCGQRFDWPGLRDAHHCSGYVGAAA
jgi:hypothetical protein